MKMRMKFLTILAIALMSFGRSNANAILITSLPGGTLVPIPVMNYSGGDQQVFGPGITWSSTNTSNQGGSLFGYNGGFGFGDNGYWQDEIMANLNDSYDSDLTADTMIFEFGSPVMGVGGFLNYYFPSTTNPIISVYDSAYSLIESAELSFSTGGGVNSGMFYGFLESSNQIKYFTLTDAYIGITDLTVIDSAPVPEPATMFLLAAGLTGIFAVRGRKA